MKGILRRVLCLALVAIVGLSPIISDGNVSKSVAASRNSLFTNVTGKVDLTDIAIDNLSASAINNASSYKTHTVIVGFEGDNLVTAANGEDVSEYASSSAGKKKDKELKKIQDNFLKKLSKSGVSYELQNRYTAVDNAVAIKINTRYVSAIKAMDGVSSVCLSETYTVPESIDSYSSYVATVTDEKDEAITRALDNAVVNKTSVYPTGVYDSSSSEYKGEGSVVAVIDTGLDYTHNAFIWDALHEEAYPLEDTVFSKSDIANLLKTKNFKASEKTALGGGKLSANDVYISEKVPFAYDYADNDSDVYPSYSNHGTHVAGIVAGYDPDGYTNKDGSKETTPFVGVAPKAQLVICKVFTDNIEDNEVDGADTEDILAAIEDCVLLGVDVINMSLGTSCAFSTTDDGDEEGELLDRVYTSVREAGISLVCAASNDYSSSYGGTFGTNRAENPDSGTVGSPAVFSAALSVASISGKQSPYFNANSSFPVYYEESSDQYNQYYNFSEMLLDGETSKEFEYVVVPGVGSASDYNSSIRAKFKEGNRIALVQRGDTSFKDKVEQAEKAGAIGIIVYNNVEGSIRMSLGEVDDPIPSASITMDAGKKLVEDAVKSVGTITLNANFLAGPFMSDFSSWGPTPDLKLKPEVTAHGGEITSTVPGGYDELSGTSMASPNMAGVISILRSYLKTSESEGGKGITDALDLTQRANQLIMSTAVIVKDRDDLPYSPRKQGAGLGSLENALSSKAYLFTDSTTNPDPEDAEYVDGRPVINLGDDKDREGVYTFKFKIKNWGNESLSFNVNPTFMTERLSSNGFAVAEQAHILDDIDPEWSVVGGTKNGNVLTVAQGAEATISVTLKLSGDEKQYLDDSFENGMYVEGFVSLESQTSGQCNLNIPFMGFYGDWNDAPMLDYDAYYLDKAAQDTSIDDENKPQASIWATQPYTMYYNETYSMPMGSFAYLQDENADRVYTEEEHNALSCFNTYYGEDSGENYLTAWQFRGLYVGLLRGARTVRYTLKNAETGDVMKTETFNRVNKAYTGGSSSGRPAFVKFELNPIENGFVSNGKYQMDFEFMLDGETVAKEENTYSFTFYADYEAPVLRDVRVRYYDYKDGNKNKQKIYLDLDVYDNHYSQAALLCYYDAASNELKQVNDYVTPIYNSVKNGTTTVSIEITDIYEKYKDSLYLQIDDYALNHSVYALNLSAKNSGSTPDKFDLVKGEENLSLDIYETHKVSLSYEGDASISNFTWSSNNGSVAAVKNGEIVGLKAGKAKITVDNGKGVRKTINVTVSSDKKTLGKPSISFDTLRNYEDNIVAASGTVTVYPDQDITLSIETDPWYYPKDTLRFTWSSTKSEVVDVDENGHLTFKKKGTASITATLLDDSGNATMYSTTVRFNVLDPFVVSNYTLTHYRGTDEVVEIPDDKAIMYIGEDAFEYNSTMRKVIIPKTVINIQALAFNGCSALEEVYFIQEGEYMVDGKHVADADVKLIYRSAFYNCTALKKLDLTNVKVVTLGEYCLANCTSLEEIVNPQAIGTAFDGAFMNCTSLEEINLEGMHVAGISVFSGCTSLASVTTGEFTAIGDYMFRNCKSLRSIELNNSSVGTAAFDGCINLTSITIKQTENEYAIGVRAFKGTPLNTIECASGVKIRHIGDEAFAETKLTSFVFPNGLTELGANVFANVSTLESVVLPASLDLDQIKFYGKSFVGLDVTLASGSPYVIENGLIFNSDKTKLYSAIGNLNSVVLPDSLLEIGDYAFASAGVYSIVIPESVVSIGSGAFSGSSLVEITFEGNGITLISDYAFYDTDLTAITLPSAVVKIGSYAFAKSAIASITINDSATEIGSYAFANCDKLASVNMPNGVKSIGDYAFFKSKLLTEVTIPAVDEMGEGVLMYGTKLRKVVFGDGAKTMGSFTFYDSEALEEVKLGDGITEIPESAFYNCSSLEKVSFTNVNKVGAYAFAQCVSLEDVPLSGLVEIGSCAFYNCNLLANLDLASAKTIEYGAFAVDNGGSASQSVSMPVVETIGVSAFSGTEATEIELPATLAELGYGAFAYSFKIVEFKVSAQNQEFFTEEGVLYRVTDNGGYELSSYPAARATDGDTYVVIDNTLRIDDYAFAGIQGSTVTTKINKVVLPFSVVAIGDGAFFNSGVTEYTFQSVTAPVLETNYNEEVEEILNEYTNAQSPMIDPAINAYYYSNFNELFVNFIPKVGKTSTLVINYPVNGEGYDNFVYSTYFGVKNQTAEVMDDDTRAFVNAAKEFVDDATLIAWKDATDINVYKSEVQAFSDKIKNARRLYNNVRDESQLAFIDDALVERLETIENEMRSIKQKYGITVTIANLEYEGDYKSECVEGETFDMSGLKVIIVYDDGSTEIADSSKLTLKTGALSKFNLDVEIEYTDGDVTETVFVAVTVSAKGDNSEPTSSSDSQDNGGNVGLIIGLVIGGVVLLGAIGFGAYLVITKLKVKSAAKVEDGTSDEEPSEEDGEEDNNLDGDRE